MKRFQYIFNTPDLLFPESFQWKGQKWVFNFFCAVCHKRSASLSKMMSNMNMIMLNLRILKKNWDAPLLIEKYTN